MTLPNPRQEISPVGQQNVDNQMVGLVDLGNSSPFKQRKKRSTVWLNFEKYRDEVGKDCAKCNLCGKVFDGSSVKGTTHLWNHFKICQRRRNGGGDKPAEAGNMLNSIASKEKSGMDEQLDRLGMERKITREGVFTSTQSIIKAAGIINEEKEKLRKHFEQLSCRFCLTIDVFTKDFGKYSFLMVHFIDDDWKLKKKLISVKYTDNYQNLVKCFKNELLEWGIDNNISSMVINDDELCKYVTSSNERENWFSCQGSLFFDNKLIGINSKDYMNDHYESFLRHYITLSLYRKICSVLNYIMETSSKGGNFRIAVDRATSMGQEVNVEVIPNKLQLEEMNPLWPSDNNRIENLLKIGLGIKEALFELENIDPEFMSINLTKEEWDRARVFYESYQELHDYTFRNRWRNYQTANMYFPMLCSLYTKSRVLAKCSFKEDSEFIQDMDKCWGEYKLVLTVAAVLDPRFKMDIVKYWYEKIYDGKCESQLTIFMDNFTDGYDEYAKGTNNFKPYTSRSERSNSSISYIMLDPSGKPCKSSYHLDRVRPPTSELNLYLEKVKFPPIEDFDILEWWRDNTRYFPTLARMARDFLSIQISTIFQDEWDKIVDTIKLAVESEKNFDSDTIKRDFICTQSWLGGM